MGRRLGFPLMPWQQHVADVGYELDDDGSLYYDEGDLLVGRQSGKTRFVMVRKSHRLTAMVRTHGPQRSMYTAQSRLKARQRLERVFAQGLRDSAAFKEITHARAKPQRETEWKLNLNNGSEQIQYGRSSFLQIDAPSRTGGHGDTLDDADIDEAFAHEDDTVEGGIRPTQATRTDAQLWVVSAAGDARSKYLYRKVLAGRAAVESGADDRVAYFEWSAEEDADPGDPKTWWSCCPALGFTIDESFMAAEWERAQRKGPEGVDTFRRAYLNQWPEIPVLGDETVARWLVIPQHSWDERANSRSKVAGPCSFAVEVTPDRSQSFVAVAGLNHQGVPHRGLTEARPGTSWVVDRVAGLKDELGDRWNGVAVDKGAPAGNLIDELEAVGVTVTVAQTPDLKRACSSFFDDATERPMAHIDQPELNAAVAAAKKRKVGEAWAWDRYTPGGPILSAVSLAAWAHSHVVEKESDFVLI